MYTLTVYAFSRSFCASAVRLYCDRCFLACLVVGDPVACSAHPGRLWLVLVLWVGSCASRPAPRSVRHLCALCGHGVRWVDTPHPVPPVVACGASGGAVNA